MCVCVYDVCTNVSSLMLAVNCTELCASTSQPDVVPGVVLVDLDGKCYGTHIHTYIQNTAYDIYITSGVQTFIHTSLSIITSNITLELNIV